MTELGDAARKAREEYISGGFALLNEDEIDFERHGLLRKHTLAVHEAYKHGQLGAFKRAVEICRHSANAGRYIPTDVNTWGAGMIDRVGDIIETEMKKLEV